MAKRRLESRDFCSAIFPLAFGTLRCNANLPRRPCAPGLFDLRTKRLRNQADESLEAAAVEKFTEKDSGASKEGTDQRHVGNLA
jgi:hypothetical protein